MLSTLLKLLVEDRLLHSGKVPVNVELTRNEPSGRDVQIYMHACALPLTAMCIYIYIYVHARALPLTAMCIYIYICTRAPYHSPRCAYIYISTQVPTTPSCQTKQDCGVNPYLLSSNKSRPHLSTYITTRKRQEGAVLCVSDREF